MNFIQLSLPLPSFPSSPPLPHTHTHEFPVTQCAEQSTVQMADGSTDTRTLYTKVQVKGIENDCGVHLTLFIWGKLRIRFDLGSSHSKLKPFLLLSFQVGTEPASTISRDTHINYRIVVTAKVVAIRDRQKLPRQQPREVVLWWSMHHGRNVALKTRRCKFEPWQRSSEGINQRWSSRCDVHCQRYVWDVASLLVSAWQRI